MKYLFYCIFGSTFVVLFFPSIGNNTIKLRNVPLLIGFIACVFLYFFCFYIKGIVFATRTRRILKKNGVNDIKMRFGFIGNRGHTRIIAKGEKSIYNIIMLMRRGIGWRYHFKDKYNLEFYKKIRVIFEGRKIRGPIVSNLTETKFVGKKSLDWKDDEFADQVINILIVDKEPFAVSDSKNAEKISNEKLSSGILFFDLNSFSKKANQYLL